MSANATASTRIAKISGRHYIAFGLPNTGVLENCTQKHRRNFSDSPFSVTSGEHGLQGDIDPFSEPAITVDMAAEFLRSCDSFQLPPFALLALYGLRAAEPTFLFRENIGDGYLRVGCDADLGYLTKGRRNKRLPLLPDVTTDVVTGGFVFHVVCSRDGLNTQRRRKPV